ncbi:MAG: hypothetical protein U5J98_09715 [Halobacteriales archaeon]|nr:hypothetical protein [Halobacteriales archaeon]
MADASAAETTGLIERLEAAADELERAEEAVETAGEADLRELADAYESFLAFIDENDGKATGSGRETFMAYVDFQDELVSRVERLPDGLLEREAFEAVGDLLDKRRLSESDMERARETLAPAAERVELLEERRAARERFREARRAVAGRRRELEAAIDERESLLEFADADLAADLAPLREPIEGYNRSVADAFRSFQREASARAVLDLLDAAGDYPLVALEPAPDRLAEYLRTTDVGEESVPRLVELADFSASKLAHYVDDPDRFRAVVASHRGYLDRLGAEPLTVDWPPPAAAELRFRARELIAVVDRFAPEAPVARLHELRDLTRDGAYERLRRAAVARERLDDDERERLRSGAVEDELEGLREERDRLVDALERHQDG